MPRPHVTTEQKKREASEFKALLKSAQIREPGLTQDSLADEMGVTQGTLSHWLAGRTVIPDKRLVWLGTRLGFDPCRVRPELSDYLKPQNQSDEERTLLEVYRSDPAVRRAIDAVAETSPFYNKKNSQDH